VPCTTRLPPLARWIGSLRPIHEPCGAAYHVASREPQNPTS
jgi:hypothetical protein